MAPKRYRGFSLQTTKEKKLKTQKAMLAILKEFSTWRPNVWVLTPEAM